MKLLSDESTILQLHQKYDKKLADDWTIYRNTEQCGAKQDVSQVASLSWNRSVSSSMEFARIPSSASATEVFSPSTQTSLWLHLVVPYPGAERPNECFLTAPQCWSKANGMNVSRFPMLLPCYLLYFVLPPSPPPKGVERGSAAYIVVARCTAAFLLAQCCASGIFWGEGSYHSFTAGREQSNSTAK